MDGIDRVYAIFWFIVGVILVTLTICVTVGVKHGQDKDTEQMKNCVSAGKDWVKDGSRSGSYECVAAGH